MHRQRAERRVVARQRQREAIVARIGIAQRELRVRVDAGEADDRRRSRERSQCSTIALRADQQAGDVSAGRNG